MKSRWFLVLGLVAGCGDSKPAAPAATTATARAAVTATATAAKTAVTATATATATSRATASPAPPPLATGAALGGGSCPKLSASLGAWMKVLQSEGPFAPAEPGVALVAANQAAGSLPAAPKVAIGGGRIAVDGAQVAAAAEPGFDAKGLVEALAKKGEAAKQAAGDKPVPPYVLFEIDGGAPWHAVVAAAEAAAGAGMVYGTFVFAAPTTAQAPPASAYHTDFHKRFGAGAEKPGAVLEPADEANPGVLGEIYKGCGAGLKVKHRASEEMAREVPKAVSSCGCKVDVPGVQALAWLAYDRYSGIARTGLTVNLAKAGDAGANEVTAAPGAAWSETSTALREAAGKGKPVKLGVKR